MSDAIIWAIIWVSWTVWGIIISFLGQVWFYHLIEKRKLKNEQEFSFQKELYFYREQKLEIIIASLEQDYFDTLHANPDEVLYLKKQDRIQIKEAERTSLINIYFPDVKKNFEKYEVSHWNIVKLVNDWELNWLEHASDRFNQELKLYKKALDDLQKSLYDSALADKPN